MMDRVRMTLTRSIVFFALAASASPAVMAAEAQAQEPNDEWAIAVHGGAGTARREDVGSDRERQFREKLTEALSAGGEILAAGGSALDAVEAATKMPFDEGIAYEGQLFVECLQSDQSKALIHLLSWIS